MILAQRCVSAHIYYESCLILSTECQRTSIRKTWTMFFDFKYFKGLREISKHASGFYTLTLTHTYTTHGILLSPLNPRQGA